MSIATRPVADPDPISPIISELRALQRHRTVCVKSMTMVGNRLQAVVAGTMGYHSGLTDKERIKLFGDAGKLIKGVVKDGEAHEMSGVILAHNAAIDSLALERKPIEKMMESFAKQLPVAAWVLQPEQKGFGILSLAIVVGEAGDLSNYANPGKLWARFGCHPYEKDGENHMGATWKSRSRKPGVVKLSADDWEAFGYSPRRRSIAYLIGENLIKQNGPQEAKEMVIDGKAIHRSPFAGGPYRRRYDVKKAEAAKAHEDWTPLHCHLHGMLLAAKLLLRELWAEWNGRPEEGIWKG